MPSPPPPIKGLLETSLYARDLASTAQFYRGLLGLKSLVDTSRLVAFELPGPSVLLVFQAGATQADTLDGRGVIPGHDGGGRLHLALSIASSDLDAWRERLRSSEIEISGEYRWPRGGVSLYFRDPDGALIELATPGLWW